MVDLDIAQPLVCKEKYAMENQGSQVYKSHIFLPTKKLFIWRAKVECGEGGTVDVSDRTTR
jgi:hypothetical protein